MKVQLLYADVMEELEADEVAPGQAELLEHAGFIPLAPGDIVEYDDLGVITGVARLDRLYTYEIQTIIPLADIEAGKALPVDHPVLVQIAEMEESWRRDAWVTRPTNFTMLVSAQSLPWLKDRVVLNPLVDHAELIRTPDLKLNLEVAIRHPDLNGLREGPWA